MCLVAACEAAYWWLELDGLPTPNLLILSDSYIYEPLFRLLPLSLPLRLCLISLATVTLIESGVLLEAFEHD